MLRRKEMLRSRSEIEKAAANYVLRLEASVGEGRVNVPVPVLETPDEFGWPAYKSPDRKPAARVKTEGATQSAYVERGFSGTFLSPAAASAPDGGRSRSASDDCVPITPEEFKAHGERIRKQAEEEAKNATQEEKETEGSGAAGDEADGVPPPPVPQPMVVSSPTVTAPTVPRLRIRARQWLARRRWLQSLRFRCTRLRIRVCHRLSRRQRRRSLRIRRARP